MKSTNDRNLPIHLGAVLSTVILSCTLAAVSVSAQERPTTGGAPADERRAKPTAPSAPPGSNSVVNLPDMVVRGAGQTNEVAAQLEQRREHYSGTVNTITPEELSRLKTPNIGDILSRVPGVNYVDEDGRGLRPDIGLRGLAPRRSEFVLLLQDGIPVQPSAYSEPAAYYGVPPERVAGIEVIKGGASILYGPNSVGGVINYLSRPLSLKPVEVVVDGRVGSYEELLGDLFVSGTQGKVGYGFDAMRKQGNGFRDSNAYYVNDYEGRLAYRWNEDNDIQFRFQWYDEESETPGALSPAQFAQDRTLSNKPNDIFFGERFAGDIRTRHQLAGRQKLETLFYANYFRRDWYIQNHVGAAGFALAPSNSQNLREFNVVGFEPKYALNYDLGRLADNTLTLGGRVYHDTLNTITATGPTPVSRRGDVAPTSAVDLNTLALAAYFQNEFNLTEKFSVTPGFRYESIDMERQNLLTGVRGDTHYDAYVPGVGLKYKIAPNSVAYANVSRAFRPPTFNDSFDPTTSAPRDLDASTAITYEVGLRSNPYPWLTLDASWFRMDFDDQVVIAGGVAGNFDTRSQGVEGSAELGLVGLVNHLRDQASSDHELYMLGGWTYLDTEFASGAFNGNELPFAPAWNLTGGARYEWRKKLSAQLLGRWVGDQFTDNANTLAPNAAGTTGVLPDFAVWDLNLNYKFSKNLSGAAGVRNLFDRAYIAERNTFFRGVVPGPTRAFYLSVTATF